MSKPVSRKKATPRKAPAKRRAANPVRREVGAIVCALLAIFCFLGLVGVDAFLLTFLTSVQGHFIGVGAYAMPIVLIIAAAILLFHRGQPVRLRVWCALLTPVWMGGMLNLWLFERPSWGLQMFVTLWKEGGELHGGGVISGLLAMIFATLLSSVGASILFVVGLLLMMILLFRIDVVGLVDSFRTRERPVYEERPAPEKKVVTPKEPRRRFDIDVNLDDHAPPTAVTEPPQKQVPHPMPSVPQPIPAVVPLPAAMPLTMPEFAIMPEPAFVPDMPNLTEDTEELSATYDSLWQDEALEAPAPLPVGFVPLKDYHIGQEPPLAIPEPPRAVPPPLPRPIPPEINNPYRFPPLSLLTASLPGNTGDASAEMRTTLMRLSEILASYRIDATANTVVRGPSVARYEFEMAQGMILTKLTNRAQDIALSLGVDGVRIAPVSGKANIVGIEVPNKLVNTVHLRDVLDSPEFTGASSKLAFALGKDIGGQNIVGDIFRMPHVLVAGTTGSGKSVCINSLIISLLYKASPDDVKLILIDPKMVELGIYNGIPHLLVPVVTDPKKAASALQWAVVEMERRYKQLQERSVRDIFAYNAAIESMPELPKMPQMVIIIDELADLMMVAGKEVEESIIRIAQKARAAGMHLVVATQRPSADVITGIMKSNIPSRIAFAVASGIDSRIILDTTGAEGLIGRGDMLFAPLGAKMNRVQGCLITGEEVEAVVEHIKQTYTATYSNEVMDQIERGIDTKQKGASKDLNDNEDDYDPLLTQAMDVILEIGQASTSMLQRRLKLGYARAARLVDQLEERGLLGPSEGSKPRAILVSWEQWQEVKAREQG